jgi:hypothetical protein
MKPLSVRENSGVLQLQIQGVQHRSQLPAVERLRSLGVPANLVQAAAMATTQKKFDSVEALIIVWAREEWKLDEESALRVLSGTWTLSDAKEFKVEEAALREHLREKGFSDGSITEFIRRFDRATDLVAERLKSEPSLGT